ncbi:carboxypeptidase-like regulatory domain-containing protein [Roseisolibacter sp. H3M3-2]|uniref:carboxypeptidase-like regulatory domain-containing protein n=1 Tax=Roseisolibacter sp. H3M3-2 TaxID=3031323 RepID=UPI0023DAC21E|nr:carboxypeptidase-like regulatory domain-containing protein [Roseisolibacter sp. H3M3-2]MDF1503374.1 carboxypeptidase-like regulatory domain-containing protein [Roseisolibacter sp. H3M3-2]
MPRPPLALLAALLAPAAAGAQTVVGQVVDGADGAPLASAVVSLLDTGRVRVAGVLTDSAGRFTLRAPGAGSWTVRADRVGSASAASEPLVLGVGDSVSIRLALGAAARLSAVRVTARERCRVRPAEGESAARLWDEARKALVGTAVGESQGRHATRLGTFVREMEPDRKTIRREVWTMRPSTIQAFRSMDVADLGARGFVEPALSASGADSVVYYAPDAEVLLSDAFLESHCLRAVRPPPTRPGQLGLAVEPVPRRGEKRADVRGTLWIDTASFELRDFEFEYVDLPPSVPPGRAGGIVGFARTPDGAWFVDRWMISMPAQEVVSHVRAATPTLHNLHARDVREDEIVARLTEVGGRAIVEGVPPRRDGPTVLSGMLRDSSSAATPGPLERARISVLGTPYAAEVNEAGEFYLEVPRAGDYVVRVDAPRAASLGLGWTQLLSMQPGRELRVEAAVPSASTLRRLHCTAGTAESPLVAGVVRAWQAERRGDVPQLRAAAGVSVEVEWREAAWPADWKERRTVRTDARGSFRVCDLPAGALVTLRARRPGAESEPWSGPAPAGAVVVQDLLLVSARTVGARTSP